MAVSLSPIAGAGWQFFNNNGLPLAGGLLYTYQAGTSTPLATYTTNAGSIANANPIVLDASGRPPNEVWISSGISYKFVLQDASAVQIWSMDNINGIAPSGLQGYSTATAGQTVFTVPFVYNLGNNSLRVFVNGSKQVVTLNYTETTSTTITFINSLNLGDIVEFVQ